MSDYAPVEPRPGKRRNVQSSSFWVDHDDGRVSYCIIRRQESGAPNGAVLAFEGADEAEARRRYFEWGGVQQERVERGAERREKWGPDELRQMKISETAEPPLGAGTDRREPPLTEPPRLADAVPAPSEPRARTTDPATSHAAAASVVEVTGTQRAILELYREFGPMTDEDLVRRYQEYAAGPRASESGIRTRRAELVDRKDVIDVHQRRTLDSGRKAIVWGLPGQYDPARSEIPFPADPEPPL